MKTLIKAPISLSAYTGQHGFYCAAIPSKASQQALISWLSQVTDGEEFNEFNEDPHVTLMYSAEKIPQQIPQFQPMTALTRCVRYWTGSNNESYVVLELFSPDFQAAWSKLTRLGAQHSYPMLTAHMTLIKKLPLLGLDVKNWVARANYIHKTMSLTFDKFRVEDLRD